MIPKEMEGTAYSYSSFSGAVPDGIDAYLTDRYPHVQTVANWWFAEDWGNEDKLGYFAGPFSISQTNKEGIGAAWYGGLNI